MSSTRIIYRVNAPIWCGTHNGLEEKGRFAARGRAEHLLAARLKAKQATAFLDALVSLVAPVESHFFWRPQPRDPSDEMVLEAAVSGQANAIVTFNHRDFGKSPLGFGIKVLLPRDALRSLKT